MRMSDRTRVRPMDFSCWSAFGIDLVKGERLIRARRVVIEECLTRGVGKTTVSNIMRANFCVIFRQLELYSVMENSKRPERLNW